jgi:hypothetical protein
VAPGDVQSWIHHPLQFLYRKDLIIIYQGKIYINKSKRYRKELKTYNIKIIAVEKFFKMKKLTFYTFIPWGHVVA